jgi:nitrilase
MNMDKPKTTINVAVVQAGSVIFDRRACLEKAVGLISEAASQGADLILFPEAFVPAYPRGLSFGTNIGGRSPAGRTAWQRYWDNSIDVPSQSTELLGKSVKEAGVYLAIGVIERDDKYSHGTLFCTTLYFDPDGLLIGKHRKIKPTGSERLVWGEGDGSTLTVFETEFGKIGGLICWENYMPLARMALYAKGVDIYLAPTADQRDSWIATVRHIACEGRCFVLSCNQYVEKSMYPQDLGIIDELENQPEVMCAGGSLIVSPFGDIIAGPLYDQEGILHAQLDLDEVVRGKFDFDVVGHYSRPDIFQLIVDELPKEPVSMKDEELK